LYPCAHHPTERTDESPSSYRNCCIIADKLRDALGQQVVVWHRVPHAMSKLRVVDVQEITDRAEEALSKASACSVKLDEVQVLSDDNRRNFIARAAARYPDTQRFRR
jgi:hypothetical protein